MANNFVVVVEGLSALKSIADIPANIRLNAVRAVNKTLDRTRTSSARAIRMQVAFPAEYLGANRGRLTVSRRATNNALEGSITGYHRPTSLARFASGSTARKGMKAEGVRVEVKPGVARLMRRAFLIKLPAGNTDTKSNLGLAIRTREGQRPSKAFRPARLGKNLWLLYGPSVDQVFKTVSSDEAPGAADYLEAEFLRLMDVDL